MVLGTHRAAGVEYWYRHRTQVENIFRDAKLGGALRHLPSGYPQVNTAWMWGALLAVSIAGWLHQLTAHPRTRPKSNLPLWLLTRVLLFIELALVWAVPSKSDCVGVIAKKD